MILDKRTVFDLESRTKYCEFWKIRKPHFTVRELSGTKIKPKKCCDRFFNRLFQLSCKFCYIVKTCLQFNQLKIENTVLEAPLENF